MKRKTLFLVLIGLFTVFSNGYSMHIMEGFLPIKWSITWFFNMYSVLGYRNKETS